MRCLVKRLAVVAMIVVGAGTAAAKFKGKTAREVTDQVIKNHYQHEHPGATVSIRYPSEPKGEGSHPALVIVRQDDKVVDGGKCEVRIFKSSEGEGFIANPYNIQFDWDAMYAKMAKDGNLFELAPKDNEDGSIGLVTRKADPEQIADDARTRRRKQQDRQTGPKQ